MEPNTCQTVAIQCKPSEGNPSGIVVINAEDFDADTMTKAEAPQEPEAPKGQEVPVTNSGAPVVNPTAKVVAPWAAK